MNVLFANSNIAAGLGQLANMSSRPTFELAFNQLQNQILKQLNDKINAATKDTTVNKVDAFLLLRKQQLESTLPIAKDFVGRSLNGRAAAMALGSDLEAMDKLISAGDMAGYNAKLADVKKKVENIPGLDEIRLGMVGDGGGGALRQGGMGPEGLNLSEWTTGNGFTEMTALNKALDKVNALIDSYTVRTDAAAGIYEKVESELKSVNGSIEKAQVADMSAKLDEVKKLKEKYGYMLQGLSIGFEVQQAQNEKLTKQLFDGNQPEAGSILNLFT